MKAECATMPVAPYEVVFEGDEAVVTLLTNVEEIPGTDESPAKWQYDEYRLRVRNRPELISNIENGFEAWLTAAKAAEYEKLAAEVRAERDKLLSETDKALTLDRLGIDVPTSITSTSLLSATKSLFAVLGNAVSGEWAAYRQALRDIPQQENFPYDVKFPTKPEE
ncbi:MAG: hypothetical protein A2Y17_12345 [Clostridiales bacterium GWF2_38_85]|nr:MAG: hypothetical protein A2Y17_12345 [Clostridiales bacterium GWF2_38_85]